ncbi:MAG: dipeptidase, partial [Acidobacteriota bacterium]
MSVLDRSLVIDGCVFAEDEFPGYSQRMAAARLDACVLTVPHSSRGFREAARSIGRTHSVVDGQAEKLSIVRGYRDLLKASAESKVAVVLAFQDPAPIENRLDFLRVFYELGVRVVQLTYNKANYIGTGCAETSDRGLTDFGRELIREMNRLGILMDLSHCSRQTALDAMEESRDPAVFSHANVRAISDNPRNRADDELKVLAERGGVIGLTPWGPVCWKGQKDEPPTVDDFLDHVDYVVDRVGMDHVGFGTDNTVDGSADEEGTRHQSLLYPAVVGEFDRRVGTKPDVRYARGFSGHHELPNVVRGLEAIAERYGSGTMEWSSYVQPAIASAEEGVVVTSFMYGINYSLM